MPSKSCKKKDEVRPADLHGPEARNGLANGLVFEPLAKNPKTWPFFQAQT
jgi:hypothetical protein